MKYLTLDYIHQHSRIDFDIDDQLLTLYADAAEETVLNILDRTYDDLLQHFGHDEQVTDPDTGTVSTVRRPPAPVVQATLMLVDHSYTQRSPASVQNLYTVPYTFDMLIRPYMQL